MPHYDDLLKDADGSGAFDADLEPIGFEPPPDENASGVVIAEPPIIHIGRAKHNREIKKMSEMPDESSDSSNDN